MVQAETCPVRPQTIYKELANQADYREIDTTEADPKLPIGRRKTNLLCTNRLKEPIIDINDQISNRLRPRIWIGRYKAVRKLPPMALPALMRTGENVVKNIEPSSCSSNNNSPNSRRSRCLINRFLRKPSRRKSMNCNGIKSWLFWI